MSETIVVAKWKRDKGIVPGEAGQIAKLRAQQAEEYEQENNK